MPIFRLHRKIFRDIKDKGLKNFLSIFQNKKQKRKIFNNLDISFDLKDINKSLKRILKKLLIKLIKKLIIIFIFLSRLFLTNQKQKFPMIMTIFSTKTAKNFKDRLYCLQFKKQSADHTKKRQENN